MVFLLPRRLIRIERLLRRNWFYPVAFQRIPQAQKDSFVPQQRTGLVMQDRNKCVFSADYCYRYLLVHDWSRKSSQRACVWIGLNPSVANEYQLDPTLRRVRAFSAASGFNTFYMLNLFALVTSKSNLLKQHCTPVGPKNDSIILETIESFSTIIVAWGTLGSHLNRGEQILRLLGSRRVLCFGCTRDGYPAHPLYLPRSTEPVPFFVSREKKAVTTSQPPNDGLDLATQHCPPIMVCEAEHRRMCPRSDPEIEPFLPKDNNRFAPPNQNLSTKSATEGTVRLVGSDLRAGRRRAMLS
ncbi:MAG: DUF1643 domain-containing protein [Verrucomicrobia bacterium]|nr:DUF1643 domain-containing protein [Verrucomicrobiota bacterium]